jgi:hypothetical protein
VYYDEAVFDLLKVLPGVFIFIATAYALGGAGLSAWLASRKGCGAGAWFFLGLLFGVIALLALGFSPDKTAAVKSGTEPVKPEIKAKPVAVESDYLKSLGSDGKTV